MADNTYSPWPEEGKWVQFIRREAILCDIEPIYGDQYDPYVDVKKSNFKRGKYWLFTVNTPWFHGYIGYRRINLRDPKFYWRELLVREQWDTDDIIYVEGPRYRWGVGEIDA